MPLKEQLVDEVSLAAIDAGAIDVGSPEGGAMVVTDPAGLESLNGVDGCRLPAGDRGSIDGAHDEGRDRRLRSAPAVLDFVERLEDLDDVQTVYANFDIPDALMEQLEASVVGG